MAAAATCQQRYEEAEQKLIQVQADFDAAEAALRVRQSNTQQIAVAQVAQSIFDALAKSAFELFMIQKQLLMAAWKQARQALKKAERVVEVAASAAEKADVKEICLKREMEQTTQSSDELKLRKETAGVPICAMPLKGACLYPLCALLPSVT